MNLCVLSLSWCLCVHVAPVPGAMCNDMANVGADKPATPHATSSLRFHVVDPDGPLPGASVQVRRPGQSPVQRPTDRAGDVTFTDIACDVAVSVGVTFPGFVKTRLEGVNACQTLSDPITVCLEQVVTERITLVCPGPLVDIDRSRTSTVFSAGFLADLPGGPGFARRSSVGKRRKSQKTCDGAVDSLADHRP